MVALAGGVRLDVVVPSAVVSILGVPGWGGLHLRMQRRGDPAALLQCLKLAWRQAAASAEGQPSPSLLVASLLRGQGDLLPLVPGELIDGLAPLYRHRLVCRRDRPVLEWSIWLIDPGCPRWRRCAGPMRLDSRLLTGEPGVSQLVAAAVSGVAQPRTPAQSGVERCHPQPSLLDPAPGTDRPGLKPASAVSMLAAPLSASGPRHGAPDRLSPAAGGL